MNYAQEYLAQANRHIAELMVAATAFVSPPNFGQIVMGPDVSATIVTGSATVNISTDAPTGVTVSITDSAGATSDAESASYVDSANPANLVVSRVTATVSAPSQTTLSIRPGLEYAAGSWPHAPLPANAPLDPNSAALVKLWSDALPTHQSAVYALGKLPLYIANNSTPTVRVKVEPTGFPEKEAWLQTQWLAVPMPNPDTFTPEAGPPGTDHSGIIYNIDTGDYWEFWLMAKTGLKTTDSSGRSVNEWQAAWGGKMNLRTNDGSWAIVPTPAGNMYPGTAASGISFLSFQITAQDLQNGKIAHPLGATLFIEQGQAGVWSHPPAMRTDSQGIGVMQGAIFRLPANIDLNQWPATAWDGVSPKGLWRMIAEAIRDYGMVFMDTSPVFVLQAQGPASVGDPYNDWLFAHGEPGYVGVGPADFPWNQMQCLLLHPTS